DHLLITAPCGKPTNASRCGAWPAVRANATPAGIIASSNGSAMHAPAPRNTARRDRCFFVMNMPSSPLQQPGSPPSFSRASSRGVVRGHRPLGLELGRAPHQERLANDDLPNDRLEPVIILRRLAHDLAHGRHVAIVERSPECVFQ